MVQFDELKITPNGDRLIIDISVKDGAYYTNVFIDRIMIDTQDTFVTSGASSNTVYTKVLSMGLKTIRLELTEADVLASFKNNLLFVYVQTKGTPSPDTPCGQDNSLTTGVVCEMSRLYKYAFGYIKEMEKTCSIPKNFINAILQFKALQLSISTGNYLNSIKYWKKFFTKLESISFNCGCNG